MTTTKAATKRAERERRKANGEKRVELYIEAEDYDWLKSLAKLESVSDVMRWCVGKTRSEGWEIKPD